VLFSPWKSIFLSILVLYFLSFVGHDYLISWLFVFIFSSFACYLPFVLYFACLLVCQLWLPSSSLLGCYLDVLCACFICIHIFFFESIQSSFSNKMNRFRVNRFTILMNWFKHVKKWYYLGICYFSPNISSPIFPFPNFDPFYLLKPLIKPQHHLLHHKLNLISLTHKLFISMGPKNDRVPKKDGVRKKGVASQKRKGTGPPPSSKGQIGILVQDLLHEEDYARYWKISVTKGCFSSIFIAHYWIRKLSDVTPHFYLIIFSWCLSIFIWFYMTIFDIYDLDMILCEIYDLVWIVWYLVWW